MDTTVSGLSAQLNRNEMLYPMHLTAELFKKRKKLLEEKAAFTEEEGNMWEQSKAILAQNINDEENLKQSRRACKEISKQLHCNARGLRLIEMRFQAASELIKTTMDTVQVTNKVNNFSVETFTARFEALKIRSEKNWETMQEKLGQSAGIDNALVELQNGLNHLLRHKSLEERAERLRKMRDDREQILRMEHEELLNRVTLLKSNLEMKNSTNQKLQQQSDEAEAELENILSAEIENLDEVMIEEKELQQQLHVCSQECSEAVVELSKLDKENDKVMDKERILDEKIIILKTELENLTALERDDPEIILLEYKSIRENLQTKMNQEVSALQDEVKRVQTELNCGENEHASLMMFLDDKQHDWSKEIEDAIATGRHLDEMITVERRTSAALRNKKMEVDIECNRLEMETNAFRENSNAEIIQYETEINDLQEYLEKLIAEEKQEKQRYEMIRSRAALITHPAKHAYLRDAYNPNTSDFGEPSSDDFNQAAVSKLQWLTTTDSVTNALFDKANFESGMLRTTRKFGDERAADSEVTGKVPSDIHISQVDKTDSNAVEVVKADANLGDYYPLPPSAFGSPLSTNDSPDVTTDCEISGSELDQSVWSDFSSVVK
uniref:Coiled-coil domain-containing protein 114 n=2 Tax=Loa loa TaxID=7209 RepID=A0A1I7V8Z3_LOALO